MFAEREATEQDSERHKNWDSARSDSKLGPIGLAYLDNGAIKTEVPVQARARMAAGILLGLVLGALTGGIGLIGGVLAGGALGGILGSFFKKSLNLTEAQIRDIGEEIRAGKTAVSVTCDELEAEQVAGLMQHFNAEVSDYLVPADVAAEAAESMVAAKREEAGDSSPDAGFG